MEQQPKPLARHIEDRRERAIEHLSRAFAEDQLEVHELEERIDLAHRATSLVELDRLLSDLPARAEPPGEASSATRPTGRPAPVGEGRPEAPPTLPGRRSRVVAAIFAGVNRRGRWEVPPHTYAVACCGGAELDFRDAILPGEVAHVSAVAFMGGIDIVVPPWMRVEVDGLALLGGFETGERTESEAPPADAPVLRIDGLAFMGGVDVTVRLPGENAKDASRRRRQERKRRLKGG